MLLSEESSELQELLSYSGIEDFCALNTLHSLYLFLQTL